ncbi:hypothetical protein A6X21_00100 [Planctopirus hydrillae]|uniref:Porin n=2 Tax=Planctopirus hydrillae TaxID=1841610 RepID=A0A1C3EAQ1_9PLAN|nr:hypothetical protein A6X21_00100 [Planctopirus hydrillae]
MMQFSLPKSWRTSLARAGVLLGAFGAMAMPVFAEDATTIAEQAKKRLNGEVVAAPASPIYQVSAMQEQVPPPAPGANVGQPDQIFVDPGYAAPAETEEAGPWTLQSVMGSGLADKGIVFGGWADLGYSSNPDLSFTDAGEDDNVNMSQLYMFVKKEADGSKGIDWGFRFDALYGTDGNDAQSFGNPKPTYDNSATFDHGIYEWALPQLYGEIAVGDVSVKMGHFYTIVGYEVVTSPDNFFYSRQLTFWNSEPFTHTGALATWKASDKLTVWGGWTAGWDTGFAQFNGGSNFLGGFNYAATDKLSFIYTTALGDFGARGTGAINSFILSYMITEKLQYVGQYDVLGTNNDVDFQTDGVARDSGGLINYLFYTINDQWKTGARWEWYKPDGVSYYEMTYGVNYKPTQNFVLRPEVRYQWSPGISYEEFIFGVDAIFKF